MGALGAKQIVAKGQLTILQAVQFGVAHRNDSGVCYKRNPGTAGKDKCPSLLTSSVFRNPPVRIYGPQDASFELYVFLLIAVIGYSQYVKRKLANLARLQPWI